MLPTTVVSHDGKTRTITKEKWMTETTTDPDVCIATIIDYKTHFTCKRPTPTTWDPPRKPHGFTRPYPSIILDTSRKPGPTPWDPPRNPHGTVRPYPSDDDERKHYRPTHTSTVVAPEATCPAGFTCQPDDDYTEDKVAVREAKVPWPAPPGCINHCVGGRGCWTECDRPHSSKPSRICPEGYSCQRKKPTLVPVPEPPEQQPAPPPVYPAPPPHPPPPPPAPFIPSPDVQPLPAAPPPAPAVGPPPLLPPTVQQPPAPHQNSAPQPPFVPTPPPALPVPVPAPGVPSVPASEIHSAPTHHCAPGMHPCSHRHANETMVAPATVTRADAGSVLPAAGAAVILAGAFGIFMV
ncbi:hypothetical protein N8I77_002494 [Diaporthe amygdali]|uniref:Uncharacterized protein n=1 Tax=Phomopsis amygdali TaxID=1214568 RepID=A0AAD9WBD5_PHOAM|nr:hypothetical protein N8I77_002494 [Diaporthe amygdali]